MVVCKCRKATKLYCFVHKVPVCGECICFPEHQICVIRTYSEWVIDGEYDWPPKCCKCQAIFEEGAGPEKTRLGCLHVIHTNCLISHIKSFPPHTASAGYVCPSCSTSEMVNCDKNYCDATSAFGASHMNMASQECKRFGIPSSFTAEGRYYAVVDVEVTRFNCSRGRGSKMDGTGMEKNLFGNHPVSLNTPEPCGPPPAIMRYNGNSSASVAKDEGYSAVGPPKLSVSEIMEIDSPSSAGNYMKTSSPVAPIATTRKGTVHADRQNSEISYYITDDEDGNRKKYSRRGMLNPWFIK
ncbi:hypothetical protein GOBAR_AA02468 [Gossypium barbadense]|uniref:RING-type domain-containing protein n=1 Tax=Gossypium barbadense TaxID=3634 RepID=A0A2P5YR62_GOSBA|nr:hypothetical protein GOBAR_AA02468 [Gossypium barbadense]